MFFPAALNSGRVSEEALVKPRFTRRGASNCVGVAAGRGTPGEWARVDAADFITLDEKREAAGYGKAPAAPASPDKPKQQPGKPK